MRRSLSVRRQVLLCCSSIVTVTAARLRYESSTDPPNGGNAFQTVAQAVGGGPRTRAR